MKKRFPARLMAMICVMLALIWGMIACTNDPSDGGDTSAQEVTTEISTEASIETSTEASTEMSTEASTEISTDASTEEETVGETLPPTLKDELGLDVKLSDLDPLMQPILLGNEVKNETVMFLDAGEEKNLLFPIETVISVTSYDGSKVYEEGKDYAIVNGKIKLLEGSSIPCITSANFYNIQDPNPRFYTYYKGEIVPTYSSSLMKWQVNVNYTHTAAWKGFLADSQLETYQDFVKKLIAGEDVTVFFYGDSITRGSDASWLNGAAPYQYTYPILFTQALADLFDYTVHFVDADLNTSYVPTAPVPEEDYVAGTRGTITYINTAIGGWTSEDGLNNFNLYIRSKVEEVGCDLFILAYGMNDGQTSVTTIRGNIKKIADGMLELKPEAGVVLMSTMMPNPNTAGVLLGNQGSQEEQLEKQVEKYQKNGFACAVCPMNSVSKAILRRKDFHDYASNNMNHPNDFFVRVYAQTLLQTVIGYENMS